MVLEIGEINKYNKTQAYPSVDITFTGNKRSLVDRVSGNAAQFTRNTIGTYVDENGIIKTAAAGEPRYTYDPETGEELGLLVEESRTNVITYSTAPDAQFDQDSVNFSYTFNQPAPDGTSTAHLLVNTSNTSNNRGGQFVNYATIPTTGKIVVSVFVKPVGGQLIFLGGDSGNQGYYGVPRVYYDFTTSPPTANIDNTLSGYTSEPSIQDVGNGWYRLIEVIDLTNGTGFNNGRTRGPRVCNITPGTSTYVWGYQIETGSYSTSYIPTAGSTITRDPDTITLTNNNIYDNEKFDIINDPFGMSAGSNTLTLLPSASNSSAIKRVTVFSPNIAQSKINTFAEKTDEFWRWRVTGDSFGLPIYVQSDGDMTIDWGDGVVEQYSSSFLAGSNAISHTFVDSKTYHEIGFRLDSGTYFRPRLYQDGTNRTKLVSIGPAPENMRVDLDAAFRECSNLEVIDPTFVAGGTGTSNSLANSFRGVTKLKSFPKIDTSSVTDFQFAWLSCSSLTSFPLLDTSSVTNFSSAWLSCSSLTSFPEIDTSNGTNFSNTWVGCNFTSFPEIDTSSGTNFLSAWGSCTNLQSFPEINTSNGTDFRYAWSFCSSLTSFPTLDISNGTTFQFAWNRCVNLTDFPANFFDNWTATPANNCFATTWNDNFVLTATSVENIYNSISVSAASTTPPASGTNIDVDYSIGTGTPDIAVSAIDLTAKGWTPTLNGTAQTDPYSFASLDLDFATNKTLNDNVSSSNLITFTRDSIGTYVDSNGVIQTAAIDTPRFDHDPVTGESLGLLVEESRTNYVTDSVDLTGWLNITGGDGVTPTAQNVSTVTPDAGSTATEITLDRATANTNNYSLYRKQFGPATVTTGSAYLKAARPQDVGKVIDFYNNQGTPYDFISVTLTNEWQRISSLGSGVTAGFLTFGLYNTTASTGEVKVLAWGAQLEAGSFPTSYIPTAGSTIQRGADVASITGSNFSSWYTGTSGSFALKGKFLSKSNIYNTWGIFALGSGYMADNNYRLRIIGYQFASKPNVGTSNVGMEFTLPGSITSGTEYNLSVGYDDVGMFASNSSSSNSITYAQLPLQPDSINELRFYPDAYRGDHVISRLTYWPKRLTDTSLQYLTQ